MPARRTLYSCSYCYLTQLCAIRYSSNVKHLTMHIIETHYRVFDICIAHVACVFCTLPLLTAPFTHPSQP